MEDFKKELQGIKEYLQSNANEDAKRPLIYPLFKKLYGKKFKTESDASGADTYIEGELVVELKSRKNQWLQGFYQALHYSKRGLTYPTICVITKDFLGVWKIQDIPDKAKKLAANSDSQKAPNEIGRINSNKTSKALEVEINNKAFFRILLEEVDTLFSNERSLEIDLFEFLKILKNLDSNRVQINTYDFINHIEYLKKFYDNPIDAVHCFYGIVGFWDVTAMVVDNDPEDYDVQIVSQKTGRISEQIQVKPKHKSEFKKYIESHYIFTNEGSGLTVDYYFSRFDEVLSKLNPEYAKQHGIFFTDINLSKFALWYVHEKIENKLSDKYIVFDPAGGSGNLVTSWRGHLKHKIVSELQPDLLKTIERRMRLTIEVDDELLQAGYTIIPKTSEGVGLNFIDRSAESYLERLYEVLEKKHMSIDKPIAFLLNPPYKSTDEKEDNRTETNAEYKISNEIIELTGEDAGKERYANFLAQILLMSKNQFEQNGNESLLMIFTPTSWLIPRTTFIPFRKEFDKWFKFQDGFIITSNEFFKLEGKWPLAFTIWSFNSNPKNINTVKLKDFTSFKKSDLAINWDAPLKEIKKEINPLIQNPKTVNFTSVKMPIREKLPNINSNDILVPQPRYNFYRNKTKAEKESTSLISGFPKLDPRHSELKAAYGFTTGDYIGFMDNLTPVRLKQESCNRHSNIPDRVWFRLDLSFLDLNKSKCLNKPSDQKAYCAYDLESAKITFLWFAITKALNGRYPIWANQFDIWFPKISNEKEKYFFSLCFAYSLAENRAIVSKFEKDNPCVGALEIFIENPFSPLNPESFWSKILDKEIVKRPMLAYELVELVKELYKTFTINYCSSGIIRNIGLHEEPYFKYFDYADFMTPNSGIIQIR
ncbi:MAG: hypothetical protein F9K42_07150, partial [Ignavibacterium sp.]